MQVARIVQSWRSSASCSRTISSVFFQRSAHRYLPAVSSSPQCTVAESLASSGVSENHQAADLLVRWQPSLSVAGAGLLGSQLCGRGDRRTKKGKRFKGSFGNSRHRKSWDTSRLREKWEIPSGPAEGSLLPRPFPPLLTRY